MNAMILKRIQTVLALLFVGSVSMLADGDDPFPEVNPHDFYGNMTVTAKAVLNGETLGSDAIVAVYCENEIRGKKSPNEDNILQMTVYGRSGIEQYLHFKVYTGGRIIEVDQRMKYIFNGSYGKYDDPYIINLPTPIVTNTSAEGWATTCLPYNAAVPEGVTVFTASRIEEGVLKIEPVECSILPKDTPVLLKTASQTSYEWLSRVADGDAEIETNLFKGTTETTTVDAGSVLTLGHATDGAREIGFWLFDGTTIPANRAYLEKSNAPARGITIDWSDETTSISEELRVKSEEFATAPIYDLQGRKVQNVTKRSAALDQRSFATEGTQEGRLQGKNGKKGRLMIVNGKKIVVR